MLSLPVPDLARADPLSASANAPRGRDGTASTRCGKRSPEAHAGWIACARTAYTNETRCGNRQGSGPKGRARPKHAHQNCFNRLRGSTPRLAPVAGHSPHRYETGVGTLPNPHSNAVRPHRSRPPHSLPPRPKRSGPCPGSTLLAGVVVGATERGCVSDGPTSGAGLTHGRLTWITSPPSRRRKSLD